MAFGVAVPPLFAVVPEGLFGPLASANRRHYWQLLCRLHDEFFGPDAPLPPSLGYPRREITAAIERYLLTDDPWDAVEGEAPDAPLSMRANSIYDRFRAAGWLRQERIGAREMVTMTHAVARLLGTLLDFCERGPAYLGAKVRAIELQLIEVVAGKAGADSLDEAGDQARQLLSYVSAIGVQVRDLLPELTRSESTAQFARHLFERYVRQLFIGDYAELHRTDHPLARRAAVLAMVGELEQPEQVERLVAWHAARSTDGDRTRAALRVQRSLKKLREIDRVDEYLARLDDDIRLANRRALAYLDYRLRAPDQLDVLLRRACRGALTAPPEALRLSVAPGPLLDAALLREPAAKPRPIPRTANTQPPPTIEQLAQLNLLRRMKRSRLVLPEDLERYVGRHLAAANEVDSEQLAIESIEDFRAYQTLITLALRSRRDGGLRRDDPLNRLLQGFRITLVDGAVAANEFISAPRFVLARNRSTP